MNKGLILTAAATGVAIVTLVALNLFAPITLANEGHPAGTTPDEVFGASIADSGSAPVAGTQSAFAAAAEPLEVAAAEPAMEMAAAEPVAAPPATDAGAVEGGACEVAAASASKKKIVAMVDGKPFSEIPAGSAAKPAAEPAMELAAAPTEEPVAESPPAEEPAPPPPEPEPVAETTPEPAAEAPPPAAVAPQVSVAGSTAGGSCSTGLAEGSKPDKPVSVKSAKATGAAAPTETTARAKTPDEAESVETAEASAPKPKPASTKDKKIAPAELKKAWWPPKKDGALNLVFAGDASFTKAIALLFDGEFETAESANKYVKVATSKGGAVKGQWLVSANKKMLLFNAPPGLYKVQVGKELTDKGGRSLPAASGGLVLVP